MHTIRREAIDDFVASIVVQAIEDAGAEVFSITSNVQSGGFLIWAKYEYPITEKKIDQAIDWALKNYA